VAASRSSDPAASGGLRRAVRRGRDHDDAGDAGLLRGRRLDRRRLDRRDAPRCPRLALGGFRRARIGWAGSRLFIEQQVRLAIDVVVEDGPSSSSSSRWAGDLEGRRKGTALLARSTKPEHIDVPFLLTKNIIERGTSRGDGRALMARQPARGREGGSSATGRARTDGQAAEQPLEEAKGGGGRGAAGSGGTSRPKSPAIADQLRAGFGGALALGASFSRGGGGALGRGGGVSAAGAGAGGRPSVSSSEFQRFGLGVSVMGRDTLSSVKFCGISQYTAPAAAGIVGLDP
jgi:hypothetical protein